MGNVRRPTVEDGMSYKERLADAVKRGVLTAEDAKNIPVVFYSVEAIERRKLARETKKQSKLIYGYNNFK
jgi:hypothetical protein